MTEKQCTGSCGRVLPLSAFSKDRSQSSGLRCQCRECQQAERKKWHAANKSRNNAKSKRWRIRNRVRAIALTKKWKAANSEANKIHDKRTRKKHPKRTQARARIGDLVHRGKIPAAKTLECAECGKQAQQYHHHLGYAPEYQEDVVPVCLDCHAKLDTNLIEE